MKKVLLSIFIIFLFLGCSKSCIIEEEKTKNSMRPLIESLVKYVKDNGIPNTLNDVNEIPYTIKSCSKDLTYKNCLIVNNETYQIKLWKFPSQSNPKGFGLDVVYKDTHCLYTLYNNQKVESSYMKPNCSVAGHCHNEWFQ